MSLKGADFPLLIHLQKQLAPIQTQRVKSQSMKKITILASMLAAMGTALLTSCTTVHEEPAAATTTTTTTHETMTAPPAQQTTTTRQTTTGY
jgi:hypothetical protein